MTGSQLRRLRESLGMNAFAFAEVLGVHVSSLYRWEASQNQQLRMDPLQAQIVEQLGARLRQQSAQQRKDTGEQIVKALLAGGALVALAFMLNEILKEE
jgi:transcriptional regulator with XRE-family HTH domain